MASKKSRRRKAELEKQRKKTLLERKELRIGIVLVSVIAIVAIAALFVYSGNDDNTEENANTIPEAFEDYSVVNKNSENNQIDVLANDVDNDDDPLNLTGTTTPSHGSVVIDGNHVIYTPSADFSGVDNFEYTIEDGNGGTNTAMINVIVADENPISLFDTSLGMIVLELFEDKTPITAGNFIKLANDGFYDGMTFYRISDDFMIQAGRYFPDGSEDQSPYGNIEFETHEDVKHVDGAISMASTGAGVGGSGEFFICDGAQLFLDGNYAPFGVVIEGIDVMRNIAAQPHDNSNPAGGGVPIEDIIINSITIENQ